MNRPLRAAVAALLLLAFLAVPGVAPAQDLDLRDQIALDVGMVEVKATPGTTASSRVKVVNKTADELTVSTFIEDLGADADGDLVAVPRGGAPRSAAGWVLVEPPTLKIPGNGTAFATIKINVPKGTRPGGYYTGITFDTKENRPSEQRLLHAILARVNGTGAIASPRLVSLNAPGLTLSGKMTFEAVVENTGTLHAIGGGTIQVNDLFGGRVARLRVPPIIVLPQVQRVVRVTLDSPPVFGRLTGKATLSFGDAGAARASASGFVLVWWLAAMLAIALTMFLTAIARLVGVAGPKAKARRAARAPAPVAGPAPAPAESARGAWFRKGKGGDEPQPAAAKPSGPVVARLQQPAVPAAKPGGSKPAAAKPAIPAPKAPPAKPAAAAKPAVPAIGPKPAAPPPEPEVASGAEPDVAATPANPAAKPRLEPSRPDPSFWGPQPDEPVIFDAPKPSSEGDDDVPDTEEPQAPRALSLDDADFEDEEPLDEPEPARNFASLWAEHEGEPEPDDLDDQEIEPDDEETEADEPEGDEPEAAWPDESPRMAPPPVAKPRPSGPVPVVPSGKPRPVIRTEGEEPPSPKRPAPVIPIPPQPELRPAARGPQPIKVADLPPPPERRSLPRPTWSENDPPGGITLERPGGGAAPAMSLRRAEVALRMITGKTGETGAILDAGLDLLYSVRADPGVLEHIEEMYETTRNRRKLGPIALALFAIDSRVAPRALLDAYATASKVVADRIRKAILACDPADIRPHRDLINALPPPRREALGL